MMLPNMVVEHGRGPSKLLTAVILCCTLSEGKWTKIPMDELGHQVPQFARRGATDNNVTYKVNEAKVKHYDVDGDMVNLRDSHFNLVSITQTSWKVGALPHGL